MTAAEVISMPKEGLRVAPELTLPLEAVTEPIGILAVRRAGKSNAAVVMAEEMFRNHLHWVAIDPKGDWWGIRSSGDGRGAGLPVPIFGGRHGDIPLEPTSGQMVADLIVDQRLTCVLDVSGFASDAEKIRFLLAFSDRLFRRKDERQEPTHVFFEEADDYVPKRVFPEQARLVHMMAKLLKQGGSRGLGGTVISQRTAVVHNDVLSQLQTVFALRTTSPHDRKAIRDWVSFTGENPEVVSTLHELADGEAWVWSPNFLRLTKRIHFRRRSTFDSGATPKVRGSSAKPAPPATLADVDLASIQDRMKDTIERAKADDPKELRKLLAEKDKQIRQLSSGTAVPASATAQFDQFQKALNVEREITTALRQDVEKLQKVASEAPRFRKADLDQIERIAHALGQLGEKVSTVAGELRETVETASQPVVLSAPVATPVRVPLREMSKTGSAIPKPLQTKTPRPERLPVSGAGDPTVGKGGVRRILVALAQRPDGLMAGQIGTRAGLSSSSGSFSTYLSTARTAGWIEGQNTDRIQITDRGLAALGDYEPLPTGPELLVYWLGKLGRGGASRILEVVADAYPQALTKAEIGERTGLSSESGSFSTYLSKLSTLELIERGRTEIRASEELFS